MKLLACIVQFPIICVLAAVFSISAPSSAQAMEFAEVSPTALTLHLAPGEMTNTDVSLTIFPFLVRPYEVDVVASDPTALMQNLTGILINGGNGDTSTFDIKFTGGAAPQTYDLNFVDAEFGGVLASIPVNVVPIPGALALFGFGIAALAGAVRTRRDQPPRGVNACA